MPNLNKLFSGCLKAEYIHTENDGDYACEYSRGKLTLYFQWSNSKMDWLNNFCFFVKPYKDMGEKWYCHRGYLRVWKSIEPHIKKVFELYNSMITSVDIVGYSHGGAIATLAHEWVWYNFPNLRSCLTGYGFGTPRVFFGRLKPSLKKRWASFHPVRNSRDIVTHCPFAFLGFRHVNKLIKIGGKKYPPIKSHYPELYLKETAVYDANSVAENICQTVDIDVSRKSR